MSADPTTKPLTGRIAIFKAEVAKCQMHAPTTDQLVILLASIKGCPVDGNIYPELHPDFEYRITDDEANQTLIIEWRPKIKAEANVGDQV